MRKEKKNIKNENRQEKLANTSLSLGKSFIIYLSLIFSAACFVEAGMEQAWAKVTEAQASEVRNHG